MQTFTEEKSEVIAAPTMKDRIATLPEDQAQRLLALAVLLEEQEGNVKAVTDEIRRVAFSAIAQNINPDERVLAEIMNRYGLSSEYGVGKEDFDAALSEIGKSGHVLAQVRRLKATGAEMTITSVTDGEIVLIDTVDNVNVEAQETFLSELPQQERADAISNLQQRFPAIEQLLKRAGNVRGLHYYDYLLICEITGAEPMSKEEYRALQERKPVDRQTICLLLTEQEMLDRGGALCGDRGDLGVRVGGSGADRRGGLRAGRPLLRVQRA